jgi:dynein heavy chain
VFAHSAHFSREAIGSKITIFQVPNMFPYDERAAVLELCRTASRKEGLPLESPAELWNYFIDKTKANLHIVLCFSPIGDAFRRAAASQKCRSQNTPPMTSLC